MAVDNADLNLALEYARCTHDVLDIFECGTPLLMREGVHVVRAIKEAYPDLTVLADSKIMDGGAVETTDICEAGADIVTVLALADDATVQEVIDTCHQYGSLAMADLICVTDIPARARELVTMGIDLIAVHTGVDQQAQGRTPLGDLKELVGAVDPAMAAVAGGINATTVADYVALNPGVVIAGGALYGAPDLRRAVIQMKGALV
ncbi:MAG: orotidine 5'-phosphate decarboxylase [Atopobiaceae bacterium]|nr:orotidine 5'-phosphate decarboxylase [Atopobiaceae bacterium]MCH4181218.1 orotidine 5'-phosphate decarboxylase [Atopobiaceae bacterium]MCH4214650.1 orotidine 5'-phosphate decarboxylase [Atopobiaceae bacterium]MCH4230143.1 orotidine 5'-phosphate decarboxylase [Atopobiaceae bacterium]MCH4275755.1 orotidine 5'-phosphate decarboxylase [Atopobiaceae bacterium]